MHYTSIKVFCKITNLHVVRVTTDFHLEHFVETIARFCHEIKRLLVLHQDVHRCRPLAHPLGRWCQGCARGVLAARSEIMRSPRRNANQIPIFLFFFYVTRNKYMQFFPTRSPFMNALDLFTFHPARFILILSIFIKNFTYWATESR